MTEHEGTEETTCDTTTVSKGNEEVHSAWGTVTVTACPAQLQQARVENLHNQQGGALSPKLKPAGITGQLPWQPAVISF